MNIPLPTDNLYKFMALFGLTLIIAGLFFVYKEISFLEEFTLKRNLENIKTNETEEEKEIRRKRVECEIAHVNKAVSRRTGPIGYTIGTGIALSFFGFLLWYLKLQRYHDKIVKTEAKTKKKKGK